LEIGLTTDTALWLLSAKLRQSLHQWGDVPVAKAPALLDSLKVTEPEKLREYVATHREVAHV
jgi:hypothetical protein